MKTAIYGASLDILTYGHLWVIQQGAQLFEHLIVAVADNPAKNYLFSIDQRLQMAKTCIEHHKLNNVSVVVINKQLLAKFAREQNALFLLRGIRNDEDYRYESSMALINSRICPEILTVMLTCPPEFAHISSSTVKALCQTNDWHDVVQDYVPTPQMKMLLDKFK